ncbi:MAG TPA: FG-GAP-like repeat-containing protein, partial [Candidatus Limnocylindrales bacterium]|nr:FG-GAP-like repeat-containing protein [Candidatus Limnocylindrales bacterium]
LGASLAVAVGLAALTIAGRARPATPVGPPRFVEGALSAGVEHVYDGDYEFFVGGGVAVFDCDDDGDPELYFAGGSRPAALFRNLSRPGELRFDRLAGAATDLRAVTGAYPLDVDGDARVDLAVLRYGENVMLRGLGDCRFERANEAWGVDGGGAWTTAFSATWEGDAALPTLAFGNYVDPASRDPHDLCADNVLVRPLGPGTRYGSPVPLTPSWCTLSLLFSSWDRSTRRDLRVSNDRHYYRDDGAGQEQLWRIEPGRPPRLYTAADGWATVRIWGMGIASHDVTEDGYPEYFLTSQGDNKLQTLAEGPSRPHFRDIALRAGVTAHRPYRGDTTLLSTAWHAEFQDVNDDTFVDLFVAKGNVEAMPDYAARDPNNLLLGRADGTFVEGAEEAGIVRFERARGAALADLDLDGRLDLVVVNRRANVTLWRNVGPAGPDGAGTPGNWLALRLRQTGPNRDAIGAWLEVRAGERTVRRELTVGGGHAGGQLGWLHVGLGPAERADVRVQWPDGTWGPWQTAAANGFVIVERDAPAPRRWRPGEPIGGAG